MLLTVVALQGQENQKQHYITEGISDSALISFVREEWCRPHRASAVDPLVNVVLSLQQVELGSGPDVAWGAWHVEGHSVGAQDVAVHSVSSCGHMAGCNVEGMACRGPQHGGGVSQHVAGHSVSGSAHVASSSVVAWHVAGHSVGGSAHGQSRCVQPSTWSVIA